MKVYWIVFSVCLVVYFSFGNNWWFDYLYVRCLIWNFCYMLVLGLKWCNNEDLRLKFYVFFVIYWFLMFFGLNLVFWDIFNESCCGSVYVERVGFKGCVRDFKML